jgi:predicted lipopolysaccharide heptosyltransferase III
MPHWIRGMPSRILIIKMRYIGDTILITPLLKALKDGIPDAFIDILVNKDTHQMLADNPYLNNTWIFDYHRSRKRLGYNLKFFLNIRRQRYDTVIDLTNNDRSSLITFLSGASLRIGYQKRHLIRQRLFYNKIIDQKMKNIHIVDYHLKAAEEMGLPVLDRKPFIVVLPEKIRDIERKLYDYIGLKADEPFVIIHPGARRWYKSWPVEKFAMLADSIIEEYNIHVVLAGNENDEAVALKIRSNMKENAINMVGKVSLSELPSFVKKALCLIGNDSAAIHIATSVGTPVIALFGPTDWRCWGPLRDHDRVFAAEFSCRPCGHTRPDCPFGDSYCMSEINFEQIWPAVKDTISARLKRER